MCILSKNVSPAGTVVVYLQKNSTEGLDYKDSNDRELIYCTTLSATRNAARDDHKGVMLIPIYVKAGSDTCIKFADQSDNERLIQSINTIDDELEFIKFVADEMDSCPSGGQIREVKVGRFNLEIFDNDPEKIREIELKYGDPNNPYFDVLASDKVFPKGNDGGQWVYIFASFSLTNIPTKYILQVNYVKPSCGPEYVPTVHEHLHKKHDYDIIIVSDLLPKKNKLVQQLQKFCDPDELKHNEYDGLHYYGYCSKDVKHRYIQSLPYRSQLFFHDAHERPLRPKDELEKIDYNTCQDINGLDLKPLLVYDEGFKILDLRSKMHLRGKQLNNMMLEI